MATFVQIDERAAAVVVLAAALVLWATLDPASFQNTIDTVLGGIEGAVNGAIDGATG